MGNGDISLYQLTLFYLLLLIPLASLWVMKLRGVVRELLVSVGRMTVQLGLIAFYLSFLFKLNNPWINLIWLLLMITVASFHILKQAGLSRKRLFFIPQVSLSLATVFVLVAMLVLIKPDPWYDARYIIPLAGMLLGNCLTANILTLERFYSMLRSQQEGYMSELLSGATAFEAASPYLQESLKAALSPMIASMATIGVVYLPGMMTGQILGGIDPLTAVAYQIMIMAGIAISTILSAILNILLSLKVCFNSFGLLKRTVFHNERLV